MPKISGWTKTHSYTISEVEPYGLLHKWIRDDSDDSIYITYSNLPNSKKFYFVCYNSDIITARTTLRDSKDVVFSKLRKNEN